MINLINFISDQTIIIMIGKDYTIIIVDEFCCSVLEHSVISIHTN